MSCHPGGDCNPGKGDHPKYSHVNQWLFLVPLKGGR